MSESGGALREIAASFGIEWDDSKLKKGVEGIDGAVSMVRQFATVIAGSEIVRGIAEFVTGLTETGSALNDASDRLGVTTKDLQELQFAAGQAGVRGEQLNAALSGLSIRAQQAKAGTGPAAEAFRALGLKATDAHGQVLPVSDLMTDIASGMNGIVDPARRVQLATQLFGGAGRRLVGILHDGEGGIEDLRGQLEELGGGMSDEAVHAADDFGDALDRNKAAMLALKSTIGVIILPALTKITDWISHAIADFGRLTKNTHVFEIGIVAMAGAMVAAAAPVLAAWLPVLTPFVLGAAAIAAVVLVVDDLVTAFNGGDSAIGRFIDSFAGVGATQNIVLTLKELWADFSETIDFVADKLRVIASMFDVIGMAANVGEFIGRNTQGNLIGAARGEPSAPEAPAVNARTAPKPPRQRSTRGTPGTALPSPTGLLDSALAAFGLAAPSAAANVRGGNTTINQRTTVGPATFHISGANPAEIARRVRQELDARERTRQDADHPLPPSET